MRRVVQRHRIGLREYRAVILVTILVAEFGIFHLPAQSRATDEARSGIWHADNSDGTYKNPIIASDYSDPDVIRVGRDFYMISSSFNCVPGIPILHSTDLVSWKIVSHVIQRLPLDVFDRPQHGKGVWAPSIRYHKGSFYVFYGDPDFGIFMSRAKNAAGPWDPPLLVKQAKGWIDPCPLWDDDGNAYLIHAWAKSRAGFNSILTVNRMTSDGTQVIDEGVQVFDGHKEHPTIEGPKFYKRNGFYYIFAPAGGVKQGWQTVLRARNIFGPYKDKIVMTQGTTEINGPHQGAWIETEQSESWFIHFQDRGAYGRVVHLQPLNWNNDWPVIGIDRDGDGKGEPVLKWTKPTVAGPSDLTQIQTNDDFDSSALGMQWQWHANPSEAWYSLTEKKGFLTLRPTTIVDSGASLWTVPNLLLQKFPAFSFTATTLIDFRSAIEGENSGLVIMGQDYSMISLVRKKDGIHLMRNTCRNAEKNGSEMTEADTLLDAGTLVLRVRVDSTAVCRFSFSVDGNRFFLLGKDFRAREGIWIGAKVGLFSIATQSTSNHGSSRFDWFRISDNKE